MKISEYREYACKIVKNYQTDLQYDIDCMNNKKPCLIFLRENGSHICALEPFEDYPKSFERVKYLFGTADRHHILNDKKEMVKYCLSSEELKRILFFNGKTIKEIESKKSN